jgi:tRNA(Ile)-lysidine synthase
VFEAFSRSVQELAGPTDRILIAVSGGKDSMVMLSMFHKLHFQIAVAHCNFQVRGKESDEEEDFVREYCTKNSIHFHSVRFDTALFASENKLSIQQAARDLRYTWFLLLATEFNYDKIATAHHFNDSIETFFINLLRKSGPAGLAGIPRSAGKIIRPLLNFTQQQIDEHAKKFSIDWKEDSSNLTDEYLRNRLRHHLIPALYDDTFESDMSEIMELFRFIHQYQISRAEKWIAKHKATESKIPLAELKSEEEPEELLSLLLYYYQIGHAEAAKILRAATGKKFDTQTHELLVDRNYLLIRPKEEQDHSVQHIRELPFFFKIKNIGYKLSSSDGNLADSASVIHQVDKDKLHFPLTIRPWQHGDRFYPLGMQQVRKVSDFLVDQKLSLFEKDNIYVLLSDNDIVCILGHRIDHRFRIRPETTSSLIITHE